MKKAIFLSAVALFLSFPSMAKAESSRDLTPGEVFCMHTKARRGNAIAEINKMLRSTSNGLSVSEKQILVEMKQVLDKRDTIASVCFPKEF